jgi:hypothetical protein
MGNPIDSGEDSDDKLREAERFITLMIREPFDYTKWQSNLWTAKTLEEISEEAMKYRAGNKG